MDGHIEFGLKGTLDNKKPQGGASVKPQPEWTRPYLKISIIRNQTCYFRKALSSIAPSMTNSPIVRSGRQADRCLARSLKLPVRILGEKGGPRVALQKPFAAVDERLAGTIHRHAEAATLRGSFILVDPGTVARKASVRAADIEKRATVLVDLNVEQHALTGKVLAPPSRAIGMTVVGLRAQHMAQSFQIHPPGDLLWRRSYCKAVLDVDAQLVGASDRRAAKLARTDQTISTIRTVSADIRLAFKFAVAVERWRSRRRAISGFKSYISIIPRKRRLSSSVRWR